MDSDEKSKTLKVRVGDRWYNVEVGDLSANPVRVRVDGEPVEVDTEQLGSREVPGSAVTPARREGAAPEAQPGVAGAPSATRVFRTPMPGLIVSIAVEEGDQVVTGDEVCVLEAMKMQQVLRADWSGIVKAVHVKPGQQVLDGDPIVELE